MHNQKVCVWRMYVLTPFHSGCIWFTDFIHTSSGQVILAGDPLQLGPVIFSPLASRLGLAESFLSRLLQCFPYQQDQQGFPHTGGYNPRLITRLVLNYRSMPEILHLPSLLFYNSYLQPQVYETQVFCCITECFCSWFCINTLTPKNLKINSCTPAIYHEIQHITKRFLILKCI